MMTDEEKIRASILRSSGLARNEIRRLIQAADHEERQYMLRFFSTKDLNKELQRRTDSVSEAVIRICDAVDGAKNSISDLEDAEAFIKAITATLRGIVK